MIPFSQATFGPREQANLVAALDQGHAAGNGPFTAQAERLLTNIHDNSPSLLTTSCTHALELAARLIDLKPGDEVIVPSYTFVSTASAFLWNGARPVFADIRPDTLNMDIDSARSLISNRTKAICLVHYAGVGAEPDSFADLAKTHGLTLIEDNAHGLGATYANKALGTFGALSTLSFHETKNVTCGEGGALIVNDSQFLARAEILREKGTDRSRFLRGQVDKYSWIDVGSSWVLSDLLAAVLVGQLERFREIQERRLMLWNRYMDALESWAEAHSVLLPHIPRQAQHSGHMFHLRLPNQQLRDRFIHHMRNHDVLAVFHYQSLHSSPQGRLLDGLSMGCRQSDITAATLVRLPLFEGLSETNQDKVIEAVRSFQPRETDTD